jgi:CRP-like cAMP-binding protein
VPIAEVSDERTYGDGDVLGDQGEMGDGLHVIASGAVHVDVDGAEIAERGPGDVVGEMSLITERPRMASLSARGDVRTIWISRRAFEGMIHDRPDIAIGVMRVLALRLEER